MSSLGKHEGGVAGRGLTGRALGFDGLDDPDDARTVKF